MKKLITLLFATLAFALVSCNSEETKEEVKTDSIAVCVDTTKAVVDTIAKVDTCEKVEKAPVVKE